MRPLRNLGEKSLPSKIRADQLLYGYRDGHRLISSSTRLPLELESLLVSLSDAGDVASQPGFSSLLSGFPLHEIQRYAFLMSWAANDIPRPGAVWTHAVLVGFEDLRYLSPGELLNAFRRPDGSSQTRYSQPVDLSTDWVRVPPYQAETARLIWALYERPQKPVCVVLEADSSVRQRLLLDVFHQQWNELKLSFSFAEAPAWERRLEGKIFDLHWTTSTGLAQITRGSNEFRVVKQTNKAQPPPWAQAVARELGHTNGLSEFLERFGPEGRWSARNLFSQLADVWEKIHDGRHDSALVEEVLDAVDRHFPRRRDMHTLKLELFGPPMANRRLLFADDLVLLEVLGRQASARCLSEAGLELSTRSSQLWIERPGDARALLTTLRNLKTTTHLAGSIIAGFATAITSQDLLGLADLEPESFDALVVVHPQVLTEDALWQADPRLLLVLVERVARVPLENSVRTEIAQAIVSNVPAQVAPRVEEKWPELIDFILDAIGSTGVKSAWLDEIGVESLLKYIRRHNTSAGVVERTADRLSTSQARAVPIERWVPLLKALEAGTDRIGQRALTNLFVAGLAGKEPPADELVARTYSELYALIQANRMSPAELEDLTTVAMQHLQGRELTRGIALATSETFRVREKWRPAVISYVKNESAFRALLTHDAKRHRKSTLAAALATASVERPLPKWQPKIIRQVLETHARRDDLLGIVEGLLRRMTRGTG